MLHELRVQTTVLPGPRIEVSSPELPEGGAVEVIVKLPRPAPAAPRAILEFLRSLPSGARSYPTWEAAEKGFQEERSSLDR